MPFTIKEKNLIEKLYRKNDGNATAITRGLRDRGVNAGVDRVKDYLKARGYKLQHGGRRVSESGRGALNKREIDKVLVAYEHYNGCGTCAERGQGYKYSRGTYIGYWKDAGYPMQRRPHNPSDLEVKLRAAKIIVRKK